MRDNYFGPCHFLSSTSGDIRDSECTVGLSTFPEIIVGLAARFLSWDASLVRDESLLFLCYLPNRALNDLQ